MAKASISVCKGKGSLNHNNREFVTENVDSERTPDNITYKRETLEQAYEKCFGQAVKEYNTKQKRADRRIDGAKGYMEQIRNSKNGEKLFYENVVQVGNMFDSHVGTEQGEICKQVLDDYMKGFQERNPNLYVFNAVLHLDEQTPHLHIDYIPLAHGYKQGLSMRNSLDRAFGEQGIEGKSNKYENRTITWQNREKDHIESIMKEYHLERTQDKGLDQEHLTVDQYKAVAERIHAEVKQIPKKIETAPMLLHKERVSVKKTDLEQLEHRAKLSLVHEKAMKQLVFEIKKDAKETNEEKKKAEELRQKAEKIVKAQEELNDQYSKLYSAYMEQKQTIESLRTENTSLKALNLQEIRPLLKQIQSLKDKIEDMSKGQLTLMRSMRYVRDRFSGEIGNAFLSATLKVGNRFFVEDGFEEFSKDREVSIPKSVAKEIQLKLNFRKGEEGLGVYTEKGYCVANCKTFREAKELFPNCDITNRNIDRGLQR